MKIMRKCLSNFVKRKNMNEQFIELDKRKQRYEELTQQIPVLEKKSKQLGDAERALLLNKSKCSMRI